MPGDEGKICINHLITNKLTALRSCEYTIKHHNNTVYLVHVVVSNVLYYRKSWAFCGRYTTILLFGELGMYFERRLSSVRNVVGGWGEQEEKAIRRSASFKGRNYASYTQNTTWSEAYVWQSERKARFSSVSSHISLRSGSWATKKYKACNQF